MPLQGQRSDTLEEPFNAKESCLKLLELIKETNSKLSMIMDEHEMLKKQVDSLKTATEDLEKRFAAKQVSSENIHVTDTMKMLVEWWSEGYGMKQLLKGLLELLPKTSKVYWQAQETCVNLDNQCVNDLDSRIMDHIGERGHTELVVLLLDAGMPVNKTTDILCGAAAKGRQELAQVLLDRGVGANSKDRRGDIPLYRAFKSKQLKIMKLLLQAGADVNATCYNGNTCLHLAAFYGYLDIVKCLVEAGANTALRDFENSSALNYASRNHKKEVVEYLSLHPC